MSSARTRDLLEALTAPRRATPAPTPPPTATTSPVAAPPLDGLLTIADEARLLPWPWGPPDDGGLLLTISRAWRSRADADAMSLLHALTMAAAFAPHSGDPCPHLGRGRVHGHVTTTGDLAQPGARVAVALHSARCTPLHAATCWERGTDGRWRELP